MYDIKYKIVYFSFILLLLCSCVSTDNNFEEIEDISDNYFIDDDTVCEYKVLSFNNVLEIANQRRREILQPDIKEALDYIKNYKPTDLDVDTLREFSGKALITLDEAIYDMNIFFDLLSHAYGGYEHFGGDEFFMILRDNVIESLAEQDQWDKNSLGNLLFFSLYEVINDNHLYIANKRLGTSSTFYSGDIQFDNDENGYRNRKSGLYVNEIIGYDISEVFQLAMNENGDLFYTPVIVKQYEFIWNAGQTYELSIEYENKVVEAVCLPRNIPQGFADIQPALVFEGDIPIVSIRSMFYLSYSIEKDERFYANQFFSYAEELKNEDKIIIDIRSNKGGHVELGLIWLYLLLDEIVPTSMIRVVIEEAQSKVSESIMDEIMYQYSTSPYIEAMDIIRGSDHIFSISDYHYVEMFPDKTIPNDKLIILLIDNNVQSSAEAFTNQILNIENTLIIGTNTYGSLITSGTDKFYLPYSGLHVTIPVSGNIFYKNNFQESVGITPDVWVSGDALAAAITLLNQR